MHLRKADMGEFCAVRSFYMELIDLMDGRNAAIGWKKTMFYEDTGWTDYLMYELVL